MEGFGGLSLVGRDADVRAVVDAVAGTGGALVVADQGLGKSALARAVLAELGAAVIPLRVHASRTLAQVPFGALAPYLGSLPEDQTDSVLAAMRSVLEHINALPAGRGPVLLVIDDAHDLDESSALLAAQLVASGTVKLLAMSRPDPAVPAELESLASDGLIVRRALQPLDSAAAHELCRQALGGHVLSGISESVAAAAGGTPMFMLALLAQERREGTLVQRNGVWLFTGEPRRPDRRLTDLIKGHFRRCTPEQRQVLETVALADPLPLRLLLETAPGELVDALVETRLVTVGDDAERLVRVVHPLYGQVLRAMVPAGRSLRLRQQLGGRLTGGRPTQESLLRQVDWSLECGLPVPAHRLVEAARLANGLFGVRFAFRAAAAVPPGRYRTAAQVEAAWAHFHSGDFGRAEELLAGMLEQARDPGTAKSAAVLGARLALLGGGQQAADRLNRLADAWAAVVDRLEAGHPRLAQAPAVVHSRTGCRLLRIRALMAEGQLPRAEAELLQVLDAPGPEPEIELVARTLLADILACTGRLRSAAGLTRRALELLHAGGALLGYCEFVLAPHVIALLRLGEYDDVSGELRRYAGTGLRSHFYFGGLVAFAAAAAEILQSRPTPGLALLAAAAEGLRQLDPENLLPLALAVGAHTAATAGQAGQAEAYLAEYDETAEQPGRLHLMSDGLAAAARFRLRREPAELERVFALADDAQRAGMASEELDLRLLALRLGSLRGLDELAKVAGLSEGPVAAQLAVLAQALRDEDLAAVQRLADDHHARSLQQVVLLNLRSPVLAAEDAGGTARQRAFLGRVKRLLQKSLPDPEALDAAPAGGAGSAGIGGGDDADVRPGAARAGRSDGFAETPAAAVKLTRREHEIGGMVLEGMQNADIAERLGLSVRTVEGHIYRMFAKLHIGSREELGLGHLD